MLEARGARTIGTAGHGRLAVGAAGALAGVLAVLQGVVLAGAVAPLDPFWPARLAAASAGLLAGALAADAVTGLVHWACDTWGDERTRWLGPTLIRAFREHHRDPRAMLAHHWTFVNREPVVAAAAALSLLSLPAAREALADREAVHGFLLSFVVYGAAANQLHLWAHADAVPAAVRWLQRARLVLAPEAHALHHRFPNTRAYCISTGWLNPLLDRLGFWRALERAVTRATGAVARDGQGARALEWTSTVRRGLPPRGRNRRPRRP